MEVMFYSSRKRKRLHTYVVQNDVEKNWVKAKSERFTEMHLVYLKPFCRISYNFHATFLYIFRIFLSSLHAKLGKLRSIFYEPTYVYPAQMFMFEMIGKSYSKAIFSFPLFRSYWITRDKRNADSKAEKNNGNEKLAFILF